MRKASHVKLGLFLLACTAVGAVAVIWLGATRFFESTKTYAAYFSQPVTGLDPGAAVKHLGVTIGRVDSVDLAPGDRLVLVMLKIRSGFQMDSSMAVSVSQPGITGAPFLALEEAKPSERRTPDHPKSDYPVLAVRTGGTGISAIEKKIASLDLEGLVKRWEGVASRVDATVQAVPRGEVRDSLTLLREDLAQLRQAVLEAQSLTRSLKNEPGHILEKPSDEDPFQR